jgi:predicted RND superfamily exporter protein
VDDTVHHVVTYRRELQAHGDRRRATLDTLQKQATPIVYVSVALAAGFAIFGFSRFMPVFYFGILSAVVMLLALVGELVLTPVVMYSTTPFSAAWRRAPGSAAAPSATTPPP